MMLGILIILTMANSVHAWGVAYGEKEITLIPNEEYSIRTSLQNMVGDKEITVFIALEGDTGIAELSEDKVILPAKTESHPIYIKIKVPNNPKEQYQISVKYVQKEIGGVMVNIATQKVITFIINIDKENKKKENTNTGTSGSGNGYVPKIEENITSNESVDNDTIEMKETTKNVVPKINENNSEKTTEENNQEEINDPTWLWVTIIIVIVCCVAVAWWLGWI